MLLIRMNRIQADHATKDELSICQLVCVTTFISFLTDNHSNDIDNVSGEQDRTGLRHFSCPHLQLQCTIIIMC